MLSQTSHPSDGTKPARGPAGLRHDYGPVFQVLDELSRRPLVEPGPAQFPVRLRKSDTPWDAAQIDLVLDKLMYMTMSDPTKGADQPTKTKWTFVNEPSSENFRQLNTHCRLLLGVLQLCRLEDECFNFTCSPQLRKRERLLQAAALIRHYENIFADAAIMVSEAKTADLLGDTAAVLAQLISVTSQNLYWRETVTASLAKRIVAMERTLQGLDTVVIGSLIHDEKLWNVSLAGDEKTVKSSELEDPYRSKAKHQDLATGLVELDKIQQGVDKAIEFILSSLIIPETSRFMRLGEPFETCVLMHGRRHEGAPTLLYQDPDMNFSATSDSNTAKLAEQTVARLRSVIQHISQKERPEHAPLRADAYANIDYLHAELKRGDPVVSIASRRQNTGLSSMTDLFAVMIHLAPTCPVFLHDWTRFRHLVAWAGAVPDDDVPTAEPNGAGPSVFVNHFRLQVYGPGRRPLASPGTDSLSAAQGIWQWYLGNSSAAGVPDGDAHFEINMSEGWSLRSSLGLKGLTFHNKDKWKWTLDETSVIVKCEVYVWSVIISASVLACGGLAIGFSVGERINGVDPSNLATYLWVVAAFVVLISKAIHVETWSWNDFLRRRVHCRSVSELHSVTGIDKQLIIGKLLRKDSQRSILKTRGPFNTVFRNRCSDASGFSIDVPISHRTLLANGLILLKVLTLNGYALVCLDARRGTELSVIKHRPQSTTELLVCEDLTRREMLNLNAETASSEQDTVLPISRSSELQWSRVVGIFYLPHGKELSFS